MPILVVDDDPHIRAFVEECLRDEGYAVETASNGREALDAVARRRPSLILLDMQMPVLDGPGVARALAEQGIAVPILVITAGHRAAQAAEEIGAAGFIPKPFELDDLLAKVATLRIPPG